MRPRNLQEIMKRFYHISTDEVYGSLGAEGLFTETTAYDPNSIFSFQKFRSFCIAYGETYGPYVLTNCSITTDLFIFLKN
jgi:dTDP-glucose 4,6-dehydratase